MCWRCMALNTTVTPKTNIGQSLPCFDLESCSNKNMTTVWISSGSEKHEIEISHNKCMQIKLLVKGSFNRPFPNYLWPLFQSESWCSSFHMKISFRLHVNQN